MSEGGGEGDWLWTQAPSQRRCWCPSLTICNVFWSRCIFYKQQNCTTTNRDSTVKCCASSSLTHQLNGPKTLHFLRCPSRPGQVPHSFRVPETWWEPDGLCPLSLVSTPQTTIVGSLNFVVIKIRIHTSPISLIYKIKFQMLTFQSPSKSDPCRVTTQGIFSL